MYMPINNNDNYYYDKENKMAYYNIKYDDTTTITGTAKCHPEDEDMESEKTGLQIAEFRAMIKAMKYHKKYCLLPSLKSLQQLKYSMKHSTKFNRKSYENKMLNRQIQLWETDIDNLNQMIKETEQYLRDYIKNKEQTYQVFRKYR